MNYQSDEDEGSDWEYQKEQLEIALYGQVYHDSTTDTANYNDLHNNVNEGSFIVEHALETNGIIEKAPMCSSFQNDQIHGHDGLALNDRTTRTEPSRSRVVSSLTIDGDKVKIPEATSGEVIIDDILQKISRIETRALARKKSKKSRPRDVSATSSSTGRSEIQRLTVTETKDAPHWVLSSDESGIAEDLSDDSSILINANGINHSISAEEIKGLEALALDCPRNARKKITIEKQPEGRYFGGSNTANSFCRRCNEQGHHVKDCRKTKRLVCVLCGTDGHHQNRCPHLLCYNCYHTGHESYTCDRKGARRYYDCKRCGMFGHSYQDCPDVWRQYHLTTSSGPLVQGEDLANERVFCFNCGMKGHFGHECNRAYMRRSQLPTLPFIAQYHDQMTTAAKTINCDEPAVKRRRLDDEGDKASCDRRQQMPNSGRGFRMNQTGGSCGGHGDRQDQQRIAVRKNNTESWPPDAEVRAATARDATVQKKKKKIKKSLQRKHVKEKKLLEQMNNCTSCSEVSCAERDENPSKPRKEKKRSHSKALSETRKVAKKQCVEMQIVASNDETMMAKQMKKKRKSTCGFGGQKQKFVDKEEDRPKKAATKLKKRKLNEDMITTGIKGIAKHLVVGDSDWVPESEKIGIRETNSKKKHDKMKAKKQSGMETEKGLNKSKKRSEGEDASQQKSKKKSTVAVGTEVSIAVDKKKSKKPSVVGAAKVLKGKNKSEVHAEDGLAVSKKKSKKEASVQSEKVATADFKKKSKKQSVVKSVVDAAFHQKKESAIGAAKVVAGRGVEKKCKKNSVVETEVVTAVRKKKSKRKSAVRKKKSKKESNSVVETEVVTTVKKKKSKKEATVDVEKLLGSPAKHGNERSATPNTTGKGKSKSKSTKSGKKR